MLLEELTANIRAAEENASRGEGIALGIRRRCRRPGAACKSDRIRICTNQNCRTMTTPLWRRGPLGPQTLCNACGIYYRKRERGVSVVVPDAASSSNGVPANNGASSSSVPSSPAVPVKVEPAASVKMEPAASVKVEPAVSAVSVKVEP